MSAMPKLLWELQGPDRRVFKSSQAIQPGIQSVKQARDPVSDKIQGQHLRLTSDLHMHTVAQACPHLHTNTHTNGLVHTHIDAHTLYTHTINTQRRKRATSALRGRRLCCSPSSLENEAELQGQPEPQSVINTLFQRKENTRNLYNTSTLYSSLITRPL